jgi:hypothetical protein
VPYKVLSFGQYDAEEWGIRLNEVSSRDPQGMKCSREGDIDVVSIIHQNLLDSAFLDHRVDNQRVHDGVIKLKPLIDSAERDGVLRPPIWRRGTVGRHQDLSSVSFCCLLLSQDPWSPKMTLTSLLMRGKALPPPEAEAILVRLPLFVVGRWRQLE